MPTNSPTELIYWHCPLESDTHNLARELATAVIKELARSDGKGFTASIWLQGELGAGKTTLVRELLLALGVAGRIKSPTYALIEEYQGALVAGLGLVHLDLYRLCDAEELEYIGVPEILAGKLTLIEWPQQGQGWLPEADLVIKIDDRDGGRMLELQVQSELGAKLLPVSS